SRNDAGKSGAQRGTVGGCCGTGTVARLDDAVQHRLNDEAGQDPLVAADHAHESALCLCLRDLSAILGDILRRLAMSHWRRQVVEDSWRADDCRLLGMRERHFDDFDTEKRRVWILVRRASD